MLMSVADGTAQAFASRGNDVDGWWALGLLLAECKSADPDYQVDLLSGAATPAHLTQALDDLGPAWARYFAWSVARHGLSPAYVRTALLAVRFDRTQVVYSHIPNNWDRPFTCTVTILDDRGRSRERVVTGHCSRPTDFVDPNPWWRPRRSLGLHDAGRVSRRVGRHEHPARRATE